MPVISCRPSLFQCDRELYQILLNCQERSIRQGKSLLVSLSQEIESIDPLAVLATATRLQPNSLYFYWENPQKQEAIAAIGSAKSLEIGGKKRFNLARAFVQNCLDRVLKIGEPNLFYAGPRFFANFTFFETEPDSSSPFPAATLFLPQFQIARKENRSVLVVNFEIGDRVNIDTLFEQLKCHRNTLQASIPFNPTPAKEPTIAKAQLSRTEPFVQAVASALDEIGSNRYSKIVLAHALEVSSPVPFRPVAAIANLRQTHPDCYIFSVGNGKGANFIGASPERLISVRDRQLVVDALAGSAPRGTTPTEDTTYAQKLLASEKEKREHQAVSDFIEQRLGELGLSVSRSPLQLLQLSNIQHLWTSIQAQLPDRLHPLEIVAKLHPTPAVAGVPTAIALSQIRSYEPFERSLYAAPLGWIDERGNSEFIVAIRSALIEGDRARLYAGAGIVAGSDPQKELAEVQLKLQAMLKALS
ncbi:MAG: isochorismate synthase [Cyanobacteriota bacterium]|nr:isochorismate synthase [Cyanobacteriota bacterium]